jgi:hypothetical protein
MDGLLRRRTRGIEKETIVDDDEEKSEIGGNQIERQSEGNNESACVTYSPMPVSKRMQAGKNLHLTLDRVNKKNASSWWRSVGSLNT